MMVFHLIDCSKRMMFIFLFQFFGLPRVRVRIIGADVSTGESIGPVPPDAVTRPPPRRRPPRISISRLRACRVLGIGTGAGLHDQDSKKKIKSFQRTSIMCKWIRLLQSILQKEIVEFLKDKYHDEWKRPL
jgi:hypothetical protein